MTMPMVWAVWAVWEAWTSRSSFPSSMGVAEAEAEEVSPASSSIHTVAVRGTRSLHEGWCTTYCIGIGWCFPVSVLSVVWLQCTCAPLTSLPMLILIMRFDYHFYPLHAYTVSCMSCFPISHFVVCIASCLQPGSPVTAVYIRALPSEAACYVRRGFVLRIQL